CGGVGGRALARRVARVEDRASSATGRGRVVSETESSKKQGSILRGIAQGISWVLLVFLLVVATAVIVVPAVTRSTPYTILTGSMVPTYPPGTLVIVKPVPM